MFKLANQRAFNVYRLQIDRVRNPAAADCVQLAEIEPLGGTEDDLDPAPLPEDLITAQEDERKHIAHELHDSIGQSLSAIKFGIENAIERIRGEDHTDPKRALGSLQALVPISQLAIEVTSTAE